VSGCGSYEKGNVNFSGREKAAVSVLYFMKYESCIERDDCIDFGELEVKNVKLSN
jgi:hypothetical protein